MFCLRQMLPSAAVWMYKQVMGLGNSPEIILGKSYLRLAPEGCVCAAGMAEQGEGST